MKRKKMKMKRKKINILKIIDIKPNIQKQEIIEEEKEKDPKQIQALKAKLTSILSEQCILCGDFMIDSI